MPGLGSAVNYGGRTLVLLSLMYWTLVVIYMVPCPCLTADKLSYHVQTSATLAAPSALRRWSTSMGFWYSILQFTEGAQTLLCQLIYCLVIKVLLLAHHLECSIQILWPEVESDMLPVCEILMFLLYLLCWNGPLLSIWCYPKRVTVVQLQIYEELEHTLCQGPSVVVYTKYGRHVTPSTFCHHCFTGMVTHRRTSLRD